MLMSSIIESYKALILTILLSSLVVLLTFTLHLKKKSAFDAETYYEFVSEEEFIKEEEKLADLIKSLDEVMNSNKAYNETKENTEEEDEEFKNTMEKIRNRSLNDPKDSEEEEKSENRSERENPAIFDEINDLIESSSEKNRAKDGNKNSSVSYSLVNRTHEFLPPPIYLCEQGGKVVVTIKVDGNGNVVDASYNSASTSSNGCLIDHALEYAKASKFNANGSNSNQIGTISFFFRGKS